MNTSWKLMGLTAAMIGANAMPAMAINKEWSAALGFLGGVMATRAHDYRMIQRGGCGSTYYAPPPQMYERPPVYVQSCPPPQVIVQQPVYVQQPQQVVETGHYEWREQQEWVPGQWRYEQIGCDTYRKIWEPGFYRTVRTKIWVSDGCNR